MEFLRSLWRGREGKSQISTEEKTTSNASDNAACSQIHQFTSEDVTAQTESIKPWDPKVTEFFKDFPEPYRQKAIERFSKKEGLHRFETFREMAMDTEMRNANKGIFLEDQREYEEWTLAQRREDQRLAMQEEEEIFYSRDIPAWEQNVLKVVPLQPGDKMWLKLALSTNASAFGVAFLAKWWDFKRSTPAPPRQQVVRTLIGSVGICCFMQVVAIYRLMDLGPFDRSVDQRSFFVKVAEDCKKDLKMIQTHIEEKIRR